MAASFIRCITANQTRPEAYVREACVSCSNFRSTEAVALLSSAYLPHWRDCLRHHERASESGRSYHREPVAGVTPYLPEHFARSPQVGAAITTLPQLQNLDQAAKRTFQKHDLHCCMQSDMSALRCRKAIVVTQG